MINNARNNKFKKLQVRYAQGKNEIKPKQVYLSTADELLLVVAIEEGSDLMVVYNLFKNDYESRRGYDVINLNDPNSVAGWKDYLNKLVSDDINLLIKGKQKVNSSILNTLKNVGVEVFIAPMLKDNFPEYYLDEKLNLWRMNIVTTDFTDSKELVSEFDPTDTLELYQPIQEKSKLNLLSHSRVRNAIIDSMYALIRDDNQLNNGIEKFKPGQLRNYITGDVCLITDFIYDDNNTMAINLTKGYAMFNIKGSAVSDRISEKSSLSPYHILFARLISNDIIDNLTDSK